jgi:fimbrial chaperone protein
MKRHAGIPRILTALLGVAVGCTAFAGAISVSPTRIELSARHPIATLDVRNEGADTVTVQLERMAWSQSDGKDSYSSSAGLIATPSVFELAPHGSQTLRIALRDGVSKTIEQAFRLYVREIPSAQPQAGTGLQMALRIGVPVFAETADSSSRLGGEILVRPGKAEVRLRNAGGHFARALGVSIRDSAGTVLWQTRQPAYLLAGGEHLWPIDSALPANQALRLSIVTETGVEDIDATMSP